MKITDDDRKTADDYRTFLRGQDAFNAGRGEEAVAILRPLALNQDNYFQLGVCRLLMKIYKEGCGNISADDAQYQRWFRQLYWNSPITKIFGIPDPLLTLIKAALQFLSRGIAEDVIKEQSKMGNDAERLKEGSQ